jgi:Uma2 family endonuclease
MAVKTRMTAVEYLALPETMQRSDLINGEIIMSPTPTVEHQRLVLRIARLLEQLVPDGEVFIAPLDVYLDDDNVVQPDVMWVAADSKCVIETKYLKGAPDLVVEVLSPGTKRWDKKEKFHLYEKYGTREYWLTEPDEQFIEVWCLRDGKFVRLDIFGRDETINSPLLGQVEVNAIFPPRSTETEATDDSQP